MLDDLGLMKAFDRLGDGIDAPKFVKRGRP